MIAHMCSPGCQTLAMKVGSSSRGTYQPGGPGVCRSPEFWTGHRAGHALSVLTQTAAGVGTVPEVGGAQKQLPKHASH